MVANQDLPILTGRLGAWAKRMALNQMEEMSGSCPEPALPPDRGSPMENIATNRGLFLGVIITSIPCRSSARTRTAKYDP
jgi:hypothetical protein